MKKGIYRITINNWEKYNPNSKPGHAHIMLSKRFFDDAKVQRLSSGGKLLFLGLLLRRGDVRSTFIEASYEVLLRLAGGSGQVVSRLLDQLQSLQLVNYEFFSLIEVNRREENRISAEQAQVASSSPTKSGSDPSSVIPIRPVKKALTVQLESVEHLHSLIPDKVFTEWRANFSDEFIDREIAKAVLWSMNEPRKGRKANWPKTMTNWLQRGWDDHLKKQPQKQSSTQQTAYTW